MNALAAISLPETGRYSVLVATASEHSDSESSYPGDRFQSLSAF